MDFDRISRALNWGAIASALSPWSPDAPRVFIDYASGSNHPGEIRGLAKARVPVGVAATVELTEESVRELEALAGTQIPVFVDSGAFSEADDQGRIVAPIPERKWAGKMKLYEHLARALGPQLSVVAPDQLNNQEVTLQRLRRHRRSLRRVAELGARVLVPVQRGDLPPARFFALQQQALGGLPVVPSVPMTVKSGTTPAEVADLIEQTGVREVHLLGIGGRSRRLRAVLAAIDAVCPSCRVTIDSNKLKSSRVRSGGPGDPRAERPVGFYGRGWGDPAAGADRRRLGMIETDRAVARIEESAWGGDLGPDYTDLIGTPSEWLGAAGLRDVADWIGLQGVERRAWMKDPDGWLQQDQRYLLPQVAGALDRAWSRFFFESTTTERKERATAATFERLRGPERGKPMRLRVGLVSCVDTKLDEAAPACELYASPLFRGARAWMDGQGLVWFILSARHGAIEPSEVIEPYSERLPSGRSAAAVRRRRQWARRVVQQLHDHLGDLQGIVFELHAGRDYADPLVRLLEGQDATVEQPLQGLQIGQRLSWYKARR